ncbi:hypothetical protein K0M31_005898 [Melipona bicolor]|uniref:Uncharacterized protein n=1 Tax=Melipona bicolor TaxID=60889 RepID=A0AA40FV13_9HYME|nr:hypothetical protein K0M31_005898 [Melipona bicolor]
MGELVPACRTTVRVVKLPIEGPPNSKEFQSGALGTSNVEDERTASRLRTIAAGHRFSPNRLLAGA